jgi:hypothetical protein
MVRHAIVARSDRMDIYHIWCDLKPGVSDITLSENAGKYLGYLKAGGLIESWRVTRCKLGFRGPGLGEFHLMIETRDMAQLDQAFRHVSSRREPVEGHHFGLNSLVQNATFALYRDFPDSHRHQGDEKF